MSRTSLTCYKQGFMLKTDMVFEVLLWALNVIAALLCVANFYHQRYEDETAITFLAQRKWLFSPSLCAGYSAGQLDVLAGNAAESFPKVIHVTCCRHGAILKTSSVQMQPFRNPCRRTITLFTTCNLSFCIHLFTIKLCSLPTSLSQEGCSLADLSTKGP